MRFQIRILSRGAIFSFADCICTTGLRLQGGDYLAQAISAPRIINIEGFGQSRCVTHFLPRFYSRQSFWERTSRSYICPGTEMVGTEYSDPEGWMALD